ncbi:hypothetical protein COLO4_09284 [Corchorus olitorius]|uniref:Pentacotripeptide-repeat region of PRORP domain-containing protein n=1 Tax=Corchorus olitorius TaxID=93759 RepID=A0A1R3KCM9_9ROSI|nr:hypothetical protein COLO4_09284 [Corchorus olitorius]
MWRSLAARSRQLVVARNFIATQVLSQSQKPLPKTSLYHTPRFLSHSYANPSDDSSPGFAEDGDSQADPMELPSSVADDETQMDGFLPVPVPGDDQTLMEQKPPAYEIDVNKLENVLSLLQSRVDASLESNLDDMALELHQDFVLKVLHTPFILGENLIRFFKWVMKKRKFQVPSSVVDSLVKAICSDPKKKVSYDLWDLLKEIGEKQNRVLTVGALNELIALFSKLGKGKAAMEVYNKFGDFGIVPNKDTFYFTIEALCRRSCYDWAWSVCERMLDEESLPEGQQMGKIISWFCEGGKAKDAHTVYLLAKEKNKQLPQSSVHFLISSLCKKDDTVKLALEMLDGFSGEARKCAIKSFSSVVHGLCRMKYVDEAKALVQKMIAEGPPPGNATFNSVINGYSKTGDMDKAKEMIQLMEDRGLKPDVYTYTVVISGYANGGQMDEACQVLAEAKKKHAKLSPVTYHTLIRGYCKIEEFDNAVKLLAEMKDFGVHPNVDEYNKLIQSLCLKALDWQTAEKLLDEMKQNGLYLNGITRGLIKAVKELEAEALES